MDIRKGNAGKGIYEGKSGKCTRKGEAMKGRGEGKDGTTKGKGKGKGKSDDADSSKEKGKKGKGKGKADDTLPKGKSEGKGKKGNDNHRYQKEEYSPRGKGKGKGNGKGKNKGKARDDHYYYELPPKGKNKGKGKDKGKGKGKRDDDYYNEPQGKGKSMGKGKGHEGSGWERVAGKAHNLRLQQVAPSQISLVVKMCGHHAGDVLRVEGESKDGQSWLVQGGRQAAKNLEGISWQVADADEDESWSNNDGDFGQYSDDGSDGSYPEGSVDHKSNWVGPDGSSLFTQQPVATSYAFDDDIWYDDHLDYLRDAHPDLDSDGLQERYEEDLMADAEEFGGYQCDSD